MTDQARFDRGMQQLAARFIARLPERQQRLQQALLDWQQQPDKPPAELIRELHSLAGAAKLFEHDALGDLARALELSLPEQSAAVAAEKLQALDQFIDQLRASHAS